MKKDVFKEIEDLKKSTNDKGFLGAVFSIVLLALVLIFGFVILFAE